MTDTLPDATSDAGDTWPYMFEGIPVDAATLTIQMGNVIQQTMAVDPVRLHKGQGATFVVRTTLKDVAHKSKTGKDADDGDPWTRHHVAKAEVITLVDDDLVGDLLDAQARRIEEAKGVHELPFPGDPDDPDAEPDD